MSKRRTWAALPGVALTAMALAAAGCGTVSSSQGSPAAPAGSTAASGSASSTGASASAPASTAGPSPVPTISSGPTLPIAGEPACADWPADARKGQLTASFVPVEVLRCISTTTPVPGRGLFYSATLERATSDISALAAALRQPSRRQPAGTMCPMIAMIPPQIVLIAQDGSMLRPTFPVNGCGLIQSPVTVALNHMPWQTVSVRLLGKVPGSTGKSGVPPSHMNGSPAVAVNH